MAVTLPYTISDPYIWADLQALAAGSGGGGTPGGTTGQVQVNIAGAFAGVAEGTAGWVLTSTGVGTPPTFQAPAGSGPWTYTATDRMVAQNAGAAQSGQRVFMAGANTGQNSTLNDLVLIGNNIGGGTAFTNADMVGSTVVGSNALPVNLNCTTDKGAVQSGAVTIVGSGNFGATIAGSRMAGLIAIGANILPHFVGDGTNTGAYGRNIFIGNSIQYNNALTGAISGQSDSILIGHSVCKLTGAGTVQIQRNVIIGSLACSNITTTGNVDNNVIIGGSAGLNLGATQNNVVIGDGAGQNFSGLPY